jgi:hypothetical protein
MVEQIGNYYQKSRAPALKMFVHDGGGEVRLAAAKAAGEDDPSPRIVGVSNRSFQRVLQGVLPRYGVTRGRGLESGERHALEPAEVGGIDHGGQPTLSQLVCLALAREHTPEVWVVNGHVMA